MRKIFTLVITLPVVALAVLFAIDNRQLISFRLTPFSAEIEIPMFLLVLGAFVLGFLLGGLFVWINDLQVRFDRYRQAKRASKLEGELSQLRAERKEAARQSQAQASQNKVMAV